MLFNRDFTPNTIFCLDVPLDCQVVDIRRRTLVFEGDTKSPQVQRWYTFDPKAAEGRPPIMGRLYDVTSGFQEVVLYVVPGLNVVKLPIGFEVTSKEFYHDSLCLRVDPKAPLVPFNFYLDTVSRRLPECARYFGRSSKGYLYIPHPVMVAFKDHWSIRDTYIYLNGAEVGRKFESLRGTRLEYEGRVIYDGLALSPSMTWERIKLELIKNGRRTSG